MVTLPRRVTPQILVPLLTALVLCPCVEGKVIYVDDLAIGANDGTSWTNAYVHLQDALADANAAPKPVEIRVGQGTYKPDRGKDQTAGDRRATFRLMEGVSLKGGYTAWRGWPDSRDVRSHVSTLSGDIGLPGEPNDNSYTVVSITGSCDTVTLDGFTISGGYADGSPYCQYGGALTIWGGDEDFACAPKVTGCTFMANHAMFGGAVSNTGEQCTPTFEDCTFTDNSALFDGGAMLNSAGEDDTVKPVLIRCLFARCTAGDRGGAMCNLGNEEGTATPALTECRFEDNRARFGGAVYNRSTSPSFVACRFTGNRATSRGGAMYSKADDREPSHPILTNCLLVGNSADESGGTICDDPAKTTLTNCTVVDNASPEGAALSGGSWAQTRLTNCILHNGGNEIAVRDAAKVIATYSDIEGGWPGTGNIDADPCFVAPGHWDPNATPDHPNDDTWVDGDYHLLPNSPCIDAGDPNLVADPNQPESDFYGGPRFVGTRIDMGADEYSKYDGGTGEPNDPYLILTAAQMNAIGTSPGDWGMHFKPRADIDLSGFDGKNGRPGYNIIGPDTLPETWVYDGTPFTGIFDGNGHVISHLTITGERYLGLLGLVGSGAVVKNLAVTAVDIIGSEDIGAIAGGNGVVVLRAWIFLPDLSARLTMC
jgi:predicted outer membrane repeat protein